MANNKRIAFILLFLVSLQVTRGLVDVPIGILIRSSGLQDSLNKTLQVINSDANLILSIKLIPFVEIIDNDNSYEASAAICRLLSKGVWTIIAHQSNQLAPIMKSITSYYHIPLVVMNLQPNMEYVHKTNLNTPTVNDETSTELSTRLKYTLNLYPGSDHLSQAYLDLIRYKGWKSLTIVYDTPEDFLLLNKIIQMSNSEASISLQKLYTDSESDSSQSMHLNEGKANDYDRIRVSNDDEANIEQSGKVKYCDYSHNYTDMAYQKMIKELKKKRADNLVLSMSLDKICWVLREASNMGFLSVYNDYVIANLDTHLLNLSELEPIAANISGFTILDPKGQPTVYAPTRKWLGKRPTQVPTIIMPTSYTMMSDSLSLVAYGLDELIRDPEYGRSITSPNCDCSSSEPWPYGHMLMDNLKKNPRQGGYSGDLMFDSLGQRVGFNLDYILHKNGSFQKVGEWNFEEKFADKSKLLNDFGKAAIANRTLRVSVALTPPYVMIRDNSSEYSGNLRYDGYCIELLKKIARKLHFRYVINEVADKQYGKISNGSWNGMIRELLDRRADLAIVDLTITKERQSAVDFTHPFMTLGIAIMYKKPKLEEAEMYSFLMPFSKEVWLSMWSAYVGMSLAIWLVSRLSPSEWSNPHPCYDNPNELDLENEIHSIGASMWFNIGSLMQQGSDLAPRSPSVRALASVWYFFTLILMSSYTANFAAFLTASRMQSPIESAEDLSKQTKIDYGCKDGGSTQAFFASSNHSTYRRMWNFMESRKHQGVFPNDNNKGINMVKKGNFAFLMESTSIEYMAQRDCELTQIGGLLDHKGYGIALPKRSPYRAPLSKAIVELNEEGELQDLKNKWWNSPNGTSCGEEKDSASATSELGIDKVGGVFVMLGVGVAIASIAALLEFAWKSLKVSKDERDSIKTMLWREVLRILRCGPSKRPATNPTYDKTSFHPSVTNLNELGKSS